MLFQMFPLDLLVPLGRLDPEPSSPHLLGLGDPLDLSTQSDLVDLPDLVDPYLELLDESCHTELER